MTTEEIQQATESLSIDPWKMTPEVARALTCLVVTHELGSEGESEVVRQLVALLREQNQA